MSSIVPSVNPPETPDVPDSEASEGGWVDPIFAEKVETPLSDDPEGLTEHTLTQEPEVDPEKGEMTREQLQALLDANAEEAGDDAEDKDKAGDEPTEGKEAGKSGDEAGKADASEEDGKEGEDGKPDGKKPRRRSNARRERRRMQRELDAVRAELAELKANAAPAGAEEAAPEPPKIDDFEDADEWGQALIDHTQKMIDAEKAKTEKAAEAEEAKGAEQARREAIEAFDERADATRDRYGDEEFDAAYMNATRAYLPDSVVDMIFASDMGPEIVYHIGTHEDVAAGFTGKSDAEIAREVGRIEALLTAEQAKPSDTDDDAAGDGDETPGDEPDAGDVSDAAGDGEEKAEQASPAEEARAKEPPQERKPVTKAPDPIPTVSGGAAASRDPRKMDYDEYKAARMAGKIR